MSGKVGGPPLSVRTSLFVVIRDLVGAKGDDSCGRCMIHHSLVGSVYEALH